MYAKPNSQFVNLQYEDFQTGALPYGRSGVCMLWPVS